MRAELDARPARAGRRRRPAGRGRPGRLGRRRGRARARPDRARPRQPAGRRARPPRTWSGCASLFDDLEQKEQLIGLLDDVRDGRGRAHLHRRGNAAVLAFGFRRDRGALYDGPTAGAGRDRRDRPGATELCPGHPVGGLHRPGARAGAGRLEARREDDDRRRDATADDDMRRRRGRRRRRASRPLQAEIAALKEQVLRYAAEAENTKRRAEREANDARAYAIQQVRPRPAGRGRQPGARPGRGAARRADPAVKNFVARHRDDREGAAAAPSSATA